MCCMFFDNQERCRIIAVYFGAPDWVGFQKRTVCKETVETIVTTCEFLLVLGAGIRSVLYLALRCLGAESRPCERPLSAD